ncbi:hypothetical protein Tco_0876550 [Tanacetum coccineum]|uniref:Uncharacterized protein n=1 Tax=Tanacetum coccineum TaxID=301880 RepID=A0ABQ5BYD4_9ASTR
MTPLPGFLTLTPIPSSNELLPITVSTFTGKAPKNTPLTNHASTSANPDPMTNLRAELEYFSTEYDEERELEPRPIRNRETTSVLHTRSLRAQRQRERMVDFKDVPNRDGGRVERYSECGRPSGLGIDNDRSQGINLPLLLTAHLGRSENGQPLQSSLISMHGGPQPSINTGENLPQTGKKTCDPRIHHLLDPCSAFGGSVGGAGTKIVIL